MQPLPVRVKALTDHLTGRGWTKRAELAHGLGWTVRLVRDTASRSNGTILSGQRGLRLTQYASPEEIEHSRLILLSQARDMIRRAQEIDAWCGTPAAPTPIDVHGTP